MNGSKFFQNISMCTEQSIISQLLITISSTFTSCIERPNHRRAHCGRCMWQIGKKERSEVCLNCYLNNQERNIGTVSCCWPGFKSSWVDNSSTAYTLQKSTYETLKNKNKNNIPISLRGSRTSHLGSERKNMETCCRAISETQTDRVGDLFYFLYLLCRTMWELDVAITCVVSRVVVGVQELLDGQWGGQQRMLGDGVQIRLQSFLPLGDEFSVHVSD